MLRIVSILSIICSIFLTSSLQSLGQVPIPGNDLCVDSSGPLGIPSTTSGTTINATSEETQTPFCGGFNTSPGVWYTLVGNGDLIILTTCSGPGLNGSADFDTQISVYCNECEELKCVEGFNGSCPDSLGSIMQFCTQEGVEYKILVGGMNDESGSFDLQVFEGQPCTAPALCEELVQEPIVIVPTLSQWGMILASIVLGVFAVFTLRRRTES